MSKTHDNIGNRFAVFSKEEQALWPENHKACTRCKEVKPFDSFNKDRKGAFGLFQVCKDCRTIKSKADYSKIPYVKNIYNRAKSRAKLKGVEFSIDLEDIVVPEYCPVFGVKLERGGNILTDNSPSLDRYDSSKGYIKGNVYIISNRANRIKSDATPEELEKILHYMRTVV